jgi:long-subunit fatty acid transport protein
MRGGGTVAGEDESVSINFHTPQSVVAGIAHRLTPRLMATAQATWTEYPNFENGVFQFKQHPQLNQKFISDARSTVRYGIGLEYELAEWLWLRTGFSREEWMMEASALSPLLYDATDTEFGVGLGIAHGRWMIDFNTGIALMEDRLVTTADQMSFPGRYELQSSPGVSISVTYRLS